MISHSDEEEEDDDPRVIIEGINWIRGWGEATVRFALSYEAKADDLFVVASPRSGTTWMQNIIYNLQTNGKPFNDNLEDFFRRNPQMETEGKKGLDQMKRPGAIKTHLAIDRLKFNQQSKYICILRNPIDVCVSFYHLYRMWPDVPKLDLDQFVQHFIDESLPFCGYFQCLTSAWNYRHRTNVLLISYEQLTMQFDSTIRQIGELLNIDVSGELLEKVKQYSSFEYLKEHFDRERREYERMFIEKIQDETIANQRRQIFDQEKHLQTIRIGKINQSKAFLNSQQIQKINQRFRLTCEQSIGLESFWDFTKLFD